MLGKIAVYIFVCIAISYLGRKYINKYFADTKHLLNRMSVLQKEIFHTESTSFDELLDLTQRGLSDQLTGLCTRNVFVERATTMLEESDSGGAVLFIDLDDLKKINDTYGHEAGDLAIMHFAQVLTRYASTYNAIAARYGGDEFIFVIDSVSKPKTVEVIQQMRTDFRSTLDIKGRSFPVHVSIGVCFFHNHSTTLEELICKADLALYTAKQAGKNRYEIYTDRLTSN